MPRIRLSPSEVTDDWFRQPVAFSSEPTPGFAQLSRWTAAELAHAARAQLQPTDRPDGMSVIEHLATVIEQRPWGWLSWRAANAQWADAELTGIGVHNPYLVQSPAAMLRAIKSAPGQKLVLRAMPWVDGPAAFSAAAVGIVPGIAMAVAHHLPSVAGLYGVIGWTALCGAAPRAVRALQRRRSRRGSASPWKQEAVRTLTVGDQRFDDLLPLIAATRNIEEAAAARRLGYNLASPAWAALWHFTDQGRSALFDAGRVASGFLDNLPVVPATAAELSSYWEGDRTWRQKYMANSADCNAELKRITALAQDYLTATFGGDPVSLTKRPETKRFSQLNRVAQPTTQTSVRPAAQPVLVQVPVAQIDLAHSREVHQEVREAFAGFCFDPHAVLARPLLNDVSDDLTAAFYQAQGLADEAETGLRARPGNPDAAAAYRDAVAVLATAWDAADIHARESGVSHLTTAEQNDVRKARRTLDLALNPNTPAGERDIAYRTVLALMAGLVKIPAPALARMTAQIETVRRVQLTVGGGSA